LHYDGVTRNCSGLHLDCNPGVTPGLQLADRFNFTKEKLDALKAPLSGRVAVQDAKTLGLILRVTPTGVKTFSLFRRVKGGEPFRETLGRYGKGGISIDQARRLAGAINAKAAEGVNVAEVRRAHRAERTFAELFSEYVERHAKSQKRTWAEDRQRFEQYLAKPLGRKKLSAINRATIAGIHSAITNDGHPVVANRVIALVSSVFGRAIEWGLIEHNPAKGIRRNRETSRDRFLQADELPRFFKALATEPSEVIRDYILLSLLTGARRDNVLTMRWKDVSLPRTEWRIPHTKNGTAQTIPLSAEVVAILERRAAEKSASAAFVFPGAGKSGHLVEPKKGWQRVLARAGIEDLHIHDLRRSLGSWQAKTGASLAIIGKSLSHKNPQTTAIYARLDLDPVRESVARATAAILKAGGLKASPTIVPLRGARRK
jgi:integrase